MPVVQPSFLPEVPLAENSTPLMAQYFSIKEQHQDCLLFFRLGDFFEMFFDDAVVAAKILDIALTRRGQHQGQDIPMCGVPAHAYENYVAKLIRAGKRVAICEQRESPEEAKKRGSKSIVTRNVVRILTPGTLTEDSLLDARSSNYLAALTEVSDVIALAWCDLTAGRVHVQNLNTSDVAGLLARLDASEILIAERLLKRPDFLDILAPWQKQLVSQPQGRFDSDNAKKRLMDIYGVSDLGAFGDFGRAEIAALGALLDYVELTQKTDLKHLSHPQKESTAEVTIDASTRRSLELTRTLTGERQGSLLQVIDRTETGAGARLLASRLTSPLTDTALIAARLDAVSFFVEGERVREKIRSSLRQTPDLERATARLALGRGGPRDLASVRDALSEAEAMKKTLAEAPNLPKNLAEEINNLGDHQKLAQELKAALATHLPLLVRDGNFIAQGYVADLDELITLRDDGRRLIASLQQKYMVETGIGTLKIKHNQVIGYHIEVTPSQAEKLFADKETFIHRQTLANTSRFTTVELSELERKILDAADKALKIELHLFTELVEKMTCSLSLLRKTAQALASLDVASALATLAVDQNYTRPIVDTSLEFKIKGGRHPVVDHVLLQHGASFIANDCDLGPLQHLWLLTGPNMAGKSTFLRQNALIALLAQMGSFVPAAQAHIGVIDRLFSRVGAADDLAAGRSTFMVEMIETAAILTQSSSRSLVILDEIGRGTATYDGLSIAWAVLEHLHEVNHCRALFATHYHELTALAKKYKDLYVATMRIKEWENTIIFLHEVVKGVADRSYGIHVAQMAGLPSSALARAEEVLAHLESDKTKQNVLSDQLSAYRIKNTKASPAQVIHKEAEKILSGLDPDALTPKEALELLYQLKKAWREGGES